MTELMQEIKIVKTQQSKLSSVNFKELKFGQTMGDHMFQVDFENGDWCNPTIVPYGEIPLSPAISALHYGQAIFEGMKAYRNENGEIVIFRPFENLKRMNISARRMAMAEIPEELFMGGLKELIKTDSNWVPNLEGSSLYIRPFMFATDTYIGIRPSDKYKFMIVTSPVNTYYSEPVNVLVEEHYTRSNEGGVGFAKTAGNYGRALYPAKLGQEKGYHQLIWTDAKEHKFIEESGTMNIMFQINDTIVTPELSTTILAGVTRDSVVTLLKDWGVKVEERKVTVSEIIEAAENGSLKDAFGAGTAATIAQIASIGFRGKDYKLPDPKSRELSTKLLSVLNDIRYGKIEDKFNWMYKI